MTPSVYLHGSCVTGEDRPWSDVDIVILSAAAITQQQVDRLVEQADVARLAAGRRLDLFVALPDEVRVNHLLANGLRHGRLLIGPALEIRRPEPLAWAFQAAQFADHLAARDEAPATLRKAVLWAAASRLVLAGLPVPAGKDDAARLWAKRVGDRWTGLLQQVHAGRAVDATRCHRFLAEARIPPR